MKIINIQKIINLRKTEVGARMIKQVCRLGVTGAE